MTGRQGKTHFTFVPLTVQPSACSPHCPPICSAGPPSPISTVNGPITGPYVPFLPLTVTLTPFSRAVASMPFTRKMPSAEPAAQPGGSAVVGAAHQDRRKLATEPRFRPFYDETPFLPFTGRSAWQGVRELVPTAAGLGILLAAVVRYFHGSWFGG